jgi:transketolase
VIGYGSLKEGTHDVHGAPLKDDDMAQVKAKFGINPEPFSVKSEVRDTKGTDYF